MSFKYKFSISLFFTFLILIPALFYLKSLMLNTSKQNSPTESSLPIPSQLKESGFINPNKLNIPSGFMGFSVSKAESDSSIETSALYYDYDYIPLSLSAWALRRENIGGEEYSRLSDLVGKFLDSEFTNKGWSPEIIVYGKSLQPLTADGPGGRIWGYIKKEDNRFQVVLIQEINTSQKGQPVSNPTQDCPCNIEFRVFLSDVEDLDSFLKK